MPQTKHELNLIGNKRMIQTKKRVGRPPGFMEPQTVKKKAFELLKQTMLDESNPLDSRIKAASILIQNLTIKEIKS